MRPGGIFLNAAGSTTEHGQVRLRPGPCGGKSMQIAEGGFADEVRPSSPMPLSTSVAQMRIPGEQRIKFGVRGNACGSS